METIKISLNKPIYETEALDINWTLCSENDGVLHLVLNNNAGYSLKVGDFIRFERFVTIENENPFGDNPPEGFEYSHIGSVAYDDCQVISKECNSAFTITAPKRSELYINPNNSGKLGTNNYVMSFKTSHDFFYQDIEFAKSNGNQMKLYQTSYSSRTFTFSATTTTGNYNGVPSSYIKPQQAIGEDCGSDEEVQYDYYFLPVRESRFNIKTKTINWLLSGDTFFEDIALGCNQNVYYFVSTNGKVKPWDDYHGQTNTVVSKYVGYWNVSVPLENNNDYAHLNQEVRVNEIFTEKVKKSVIPDTINMEKVKYKPVISGTTIDLVSGLTFNLHFRERTGDDWHVIKDKRWNDTENEQSDGLYYLGFKDNDVRYQKMKVQKSFIRLSFYRSGDSGDTFNPLNASLLYYSTVFLDSGELFGKFNNERTYLINNGNSWDENNSTFVLSAGAETNAYERIDSQIKIFNEFNTTKSSEGFNIYLFQDDAPENSTDTIYMKVEFNHAGFGRTIPMTKVKKGLTMDNYYDYLYIPLRISHIGNEYIYSFDDFSENRTDYIVNDVENRSITFNLYEPKILSDGKTV